MNGSAWYLFEFLFWNVFARSSLLLDSATFLSSLGG